MKGTCGGLYNTGKCILRPTECAEFGLNIITGAVCNDRVGNKCTMKLKLRKINLKEKIIKENSRGIL